MILERKMQLNISELTRQIGEFQPNFGGRAFIDSPASLVKFADLMQAYNGAMKEISAKLEVLDDEFHIRHSHNPIHHLECRIKGINSIYGKLKRLNLPLDLDSVREHIQDIAGIRVICNFIDDIYEIEKLLLRQTDITLINRKDYITNPKESGYRSLHLVVTVPVFLSDGTEIVPVEIQMRTVAMDYWASLEHMLCYKNNKTDTREYSAKLLECANTLADTEKTMQEIRSGIAA